MILEQNRLIGAAAFFLACVFFWAAPVQAQGYSGVVAEDGGVISAGESGVIDSRGHPVRDPGPGLYDPGYFARESQKQKQQRQAVSSDLKKQQEDLRAARAAEAVRQKEARQERLEKKLSGKDNPYLGRRQGLKVSPKPVVPAEVAPPDAPAAAAEKKEAAKKKPFDFSRDAGRRNKKEEKKAKEPRSVIDSMMDALR